MKWIAFLVLSFLCLSLSCQNSPKRITHLRGLAHTLPYHIQIGQGLSPHEKRLVKALIDETFAEVDQIYNHWNPQSELSKLNQTPAKEKTLLSPALFQVLTLAKNISELTQGRYDPTLGALIASWKENLKEGRLPPSFDTPTGWEHFQFEKQKISKDSETVSLDLDGMIKGLLN